MTALYVDAQRAAQFEALRQALWIVRGAQRIPALDNNPHYIAHLDGAELQLGAALDYVNPGWDADGENSK